MKSELFLNVTLIFQGIINSILTLSSFVPLSRMSYVAYVRFSDVKNKQKF